MKRLYLLRHAKAMPSEGESDAERRLAPKGIEDAAALGKLLKTKQYQPAVIHCSPSRRTRETLDGLMQSLDETKTHFENQIYNASRSDLFRLIQSIDDSYDSLLIVAHNPGIHELAATMAAEDNGGLINRLMSSFSPGTMCVFDCPRGSWADLQPADNIIVDYLAPSDYNDPARPTRWM